MKIFILKNQWGGGGIDHLPTLRMRTSFIMLNVLQTILMNQS